MEYENSVEFTSGSAVRARRCQAASKRTKQQCGAPAMRGKAVCRFHGGMSTGPKTEAGRQRIAAAKTIHGRETRALRARTQAKLAEMKELMKMIRWL